jgi:dihydrofolate synthase/folylpolyglutamate synthase
MTTPWPRDYVPSDWNDPLDDVVTSLMAHYNSGRRRHDLMAVERLAGMVLPTRVPLHVVVVGTNGKSSTAHFLATLLHRHGVHVGLYTSPHIRYWNDRVQTNLEPVAPSAWRQALVSVHEAARTQKQRPGDLRFFDVLTLAAESLFVQDEIEVAIFEAGIGGRLDAVRVLQPQLTLLTSIGEDHEELLGREPRERLLDKVQVAPTGGAIISSALADELASELVQAARRQGLSLTLLADVQRDLSQPAVPAYQRANAALAEAGARWVVGGRVGSVQDLRFGGRFEQGETGSVQWIADVAHNPTAWSAFLDALPDEPFEVVAAITAPRPTEQFVEVLARHAGRIGHLTSTGITVRPARDPETIAASARAAGMDAVAVADPREAFASAWRRARDNGRRLLVFGSNYLVVDYFAWVASFESHAEAGRR